MRFNSTNSLLFEELFYSIYFFLEIRDRTAGIIILLMDMLSCQIYYQFNADQNKIYTKVCYLFDIE